MVYIFSAWAIPMTIFWGWYFISLYDLGGGYFMLSPAANQMVFKIYGEVLGIDPELIPWMAAKACIIDTLLIGAIWAFRRRRNIAAWIRDRRAVREAGKLQPSA